MIIIQISPEKPAGRAEALMEEMETVPAAVPAALSRGPFPAVHKNKSD